MNRQVERDIFGSFDLCPYHYGGDKRDKKPSDFTLFLGVRRYCTYFKGFFRITSLKEGML
jgi:hypothetical protein